MAIFKTCLSIFALLLTLTILETGNFIESPSRVLPEHNEEESCIPHTRGKRSVATNQWNYTLDVVLNASEVAIIQQFQSSLNSFPIQLGNNTEISVITFTTVCSSTATGFQCRCEDNFAWPYSTCVTYGACDSIVSGICTCIDAIPADGQSCQAISGLLAQVEYDVDVELNFTDIGTVDALRSILDAGGFSLALGPTVNVTHINITTGRVYLWSEGAFKQ
ncbi:adhesion G protein-coupled receptor F5 [Trematomus bernacchii]|uniref:adhesion G protein-coupled receptor F5 n=1 Tax=Trematomus bernacchii TaxID=40690 RepID=UPI00146D80A7|nr:adhesion G protein-coupled receptor F5 [Trematomus bernacchii]